MIYKASNHPVFDSNVATIQRNLNRLNQMLGGNAWETLVDDGLYGRGTARAVKAFQTLYHLSPDGQYGTDTDAALRTALSDAKTQRNAVPVSASINSDITPFNNQVMARGSQLTSFNLQGDSQQVTSQRPLVASINPALQNYTVFQETGMTESKTTKDNTMTSTVSANDTESDIDEICKIANTLFSGLLNGLTGSLDIIPDLDELNGWLAKFRKLEKYAEQFLNNAKENLSEAKKNIDKLVNAVRKLIQKQALAYSIAFSKDVQAISKSYQSAKTVALQQVGKFQDDLSAFGDYVKNYCRNKAKDLAKIVDECISSGKDGLAEAQKKVNAKLAHHTPAIKAVANKPWIKAIKGFPATFLLNFVGVFEVLINRNAYGADYEEKMKKAICQAIDAILLGLISTLLTKLVVLAIFGAAAGTAASAIVIAIGVVISLALSGIYYLVAGRKDVTFTEWVIENLHKTFEQRHKELLNRPIQYSALIDQNTHPKW